jgi:hypothetical protein
MASLFSQGINELPNEITDMICDDAAEHYEASKNLRLTARRFYARATKNSFAGLVVHQHSDSYEKVNQIAQSPELAPLVQILYLSREEPLPDYFEVREFLMESGEQDLYLWLGHHIEHAELRESIMEEERDRRDYPDSEDDEMDVDSCFVDSPFFQGNLRLVSEPAPNLQETIHAYGYWFKGQHVIKQWFYEAMEAQKTSQPTLQRVPFERLRGVHSLESYDRDNLVKLNRRKPGYENLDFTRVEIETHSRGDGFEYTLFDEGSDNFSLELFLLERQRYGSTIEKLKLRAFDEICTEPHLQINFSCLRSLTIDLCDESGNKTPSTLDQLYDIQIADCVVAPWFRTITNLESLRLIQDPSDISINLLGFLGQFQFPKLRHLDLVHIPATADTLREFLVAHPSLVKMNIEEPVIQPRHWNQLRSEIPSLFSGVFKGKAATILRLTDSFKPEDNAHFVESVETSTIRLADAVRIWWADVKVFPSE